MNLKVAFLYTELAGYTISCLRELAANGAEILVYRYPVNNEAPFEFKNTYSFRLHDRQSVNEAEILNNIRKFSPDLVICSGWADKAYTSVCSALKKKGVKTIVCFDNHWKLSPRKLIASVLGRFLVKKYFTYAWVPGKIQKQFALKLGFKNDEVFQGFYSADTQLWEQHYLLHREDRPAKRFLYAGRYYDFKGVAELWTAFAEFSEQFPEWELWCAGTGTVAPYSHPKIKHLGFVQPADMPAIVKETSVFILPSRFEPWGVVVHEMAAAGMPMILSDEVGAAEAFLDEGKNGFMFRHGNVAELVDRMKKVASLSEIDLKKMGAESNRLSKKISLESWVDTVNEIAKIEL